MSEDRQRKSIRSILSRVGAVVTNDHFVYASGLHGSVYFNKEALYPYPWLISELCRFIVSHFTKSEGGVEYEVVAGPEKGAIILTQWIAYNSTTHQDKSLGILAVYAEKEGNDFVFSPGFAKLLTGKKVLVVEDTLTTGGAVKKVIQAAHAKGGEVIGVGALCNRGGVTAEMLGVPQLYSLLDINLAAWPANDCPLCMRGRRINTELGHGQEYLLKTGPY